MAGGPYTLEIAGRSKLFDDCEDACRSLFREVGDQNVYEVQPGNMPMLKVFQQSGLSIDVHRKPEDVRVTLLAQTFMFTIRAATGTLARKLA